MIDYRAAASSFSLIFLAELAGKTTLATIVLAAGSHPGAVFLGAGVAFTIHVGIALALGKLIALLPAKLVHGAVGTLFLALAVWAWRQADGTERPIRKGSGFATAFGMIFLTQWGDPSQLATAALAAKYGAGTVAVPATLAFWSIAGLASWIGHYSKSRLPMHALHRAAAIVFAVVGIGFLARLLCAVQ